MGFFFLRKQVLLLYIKEEEERKKGDKKIWEQEKEKEKAGIKLSIKKTKIMASGPITSWQISGETIQVVRDFIFLGSKIIAVDYCSHGIKDACSLEEKLWQA